MPDAAEQNKYIHRDLSWLNFNERVLEEASDIHNPLLERLKFLAIFVSNLDEFYAVRVSGVKRLVDSEYNRRDQYGFYPQEILTEIKAKVDGLIKKLYEVYQNKITKEFAKHNIFLKKVEDFDAEQKKYVKQYFESTIFPIITPMAIDQSRPFPVLPSKTIAFAVRLVHKDSTLLAIIPIPRNIPRVIKLPSEKDEFNYILLEDLIREHLSIFFKGYQIEEYTLFRVIKDSELYVDEGFTPDLLKAIESEVKKRSWAKVVYMEIEKSASPELLHTLCEGLNFPKEEVITLANTLDLTYLFQFLGKIDKPQLMYKSFVPAKVEYENIFDKINEGDFLLHLPFQSFYPTVHLIENAAKDPDVLAIKMTLYRTNEDSAIIRALQEAAKNKKQVTVVVEIKARFDEEKNISWVRELEAAGCHVVYGIAGLKIHSKMTLIVRKEEGRIRRYIHLSTGNYNENTAKIYTDIGYFTSNEDFAKDISDIFNVMTGYSVPAAWRRIIAGPHDLRKFFFELIDKEIGFQKKNKNGLIVGKMNSLEDLKMVDKLYEASQADVKINLLVRGICTLIPEVKDLSENIEVRSIVGRFLEHSRIYLFGNNGNPRIFMSSADWMTRNFDRRIEVLFEVQNEPLKDRLRTILDLYWKDNTKSRQLLANRTYTRYKDDHPKFNVQEYLIENGG